MSYTHPCGKSFTAFPQAFSLLVAGRSSNSVYFSTCPTTTKTEYLEERDRGCGGKGGCEMRRIPRAGGVR